ncbi:MAG TPA: hypothetical protein VGB09_00475 [Candidatus Binatia bacterium]
MTSFMIGQMIRRMCRKVLAALLIFGWVILSGFDLVEDLDEVPGQAGVSSASSPDNSKSKRGGWGTLANNIVESATRIPQAFVEFFGLTATIFDLDVNFDFRRYVQLHKLYRVFLI